MSKKYSELEKRKTEFENLGIFSESLMQTIPTFSRQIGEIHEKLSARRKNLKKENSGQDTTLQELVKSIQENTQVELQKQSSTLVSLLSYMQQKVEGGLPPALVAGQVGTENVEKQQE